MSGAAPLLLAGHGSRDPRAAREFGALLDRLRAKPGAPPVTGGFLELCSPPLTAAVRDLVADGHRHLVAVPLVLVAASHAKGDVPAALHRESRRHPGIAFRYGRPLGPHPTLLRLLADRLHAAIGEGERGDTAVLLVGRGSTDPDANAEVYKVARLLWEGYGDGFAGMTETAFVSLARPSVPDGLERCRRLGASRVVVLPYFLFSGVLPDRVAAQAAAYAEANGVEVRCAHVLGESDDLAALVLERYREALDGDIRMNCDTCVYRVAVPGFEHRVGAPQVPHAHPDDPGDRARPDDPAGGHHAHLH